MKMKPSLYFMAIVFAYDEQTPPANDKKEFMQQSQMLLDGVEPLLAPVQELVLSHGGMRNRGKQNNDMMQFRFDALLSIAYDIGIDALEASPMASLNDARPARKKLRDAFLALPSLSFTLREDLPAQLKTYKLPLLPRQMYAYHLYCGTPFFMIGRTPTDKPEGSHIVYAPYVLHPIIQFMMMYRG